MPIRICCMAISIEYFFTLQCVVLIKVSKVRINITSVGGCNCFVEAITGGSRSV